MVTRAGAKKPVIGISGRRFQASELFPKDADLMRELSFDGFFRAYAEKIELAGGVPVYLPSSTDVAAVLDHIDGLVLSGGLDLDPRLYGAVTSELVGRFDTEQDEFDIALARHAVHTGMPVLGCCRGNQVVNVALGGTLLEDLPAAGFLGHNIRDFPPSQTRHTVAISAGSTLHELYGPNVEVNSFHHQAVGELGDGLIVTARAADGTVEAVERPDLPLIGVQWHPELHAGVDPVIRWVVDAAASNAQHTRIPVKERR